MSSKDGEFWALAACQGGKTLAVATGVWEQFQGGSRLVGTGLAVLDSTSLVERLTVEPPDRPITALAYSARDGSLAGGVGEDGTIKFWDLATGKEIDAVKISTAGVNSLAFSYDGTNLVAGIAGGTVELWNASTRRRRILVHGQGMTVPWVVFGVAILLMIGAWFRMARRARRKQEIALPRKINDTDARC